MEIALAVIFGTLWVAAVFGTYITLGLYLKMDWEVGMLYWVFSLCVFIPLAMTPFWIYDSVVAHGGA